MIEIITITGGLPRDAVQKFTPQGAAVTEFTISSKDSKYNDQTKQWEDTRKLYLDVAIWDGNKQHNPVPWSRLASELKQGDQVAVTGKLITRQWQDKEGNNRSKVEFLARSFYKMPDTNAGSSRPQQGAQAAQWGNQGGFSAAQNNVNSVMGGDENPPF